MGRTVEGLVWPAMDFKTDLSAVGDPEGFNSGVMLRPEF